ncbi:MAG TPA: hypothetical protein VFZ53_33025 [Polyangiaceae bacterium]
MATEDDKIDTGALATVVAVGAAGMIGISLAVNALVRHEVGAVGAGRDEVGADAYRALKQQQLDKLSAPPGWADQNKGQVSIPIDRAMGLVLADLKRNPWSATPAPPPDAGADAAAETADAGAEGADAGADAAAGAGADAAAASESDAGVAPEPSGSAALSPGTPPASSGAAPSPQPSAPRVLPPPTVPPAPPPPASAPAQPTPAPTQATKP